MGMSYQRMVQRVRPTRGELYAVLVLILGLVVVYYVSFWLRFEGVMDSHPWRLFSASVGWVVSVKLAIFAAFGVHRGWGRYVTFHNLILLCKAATASLLALALLKFLVLTDANLPRSVMLIDWMLSIAVVGGIRSLSRFLAERDPLPFMAGGKTPVFIVGANDAGEALLRAIRRGQDLPYRVVGFITQNAGELGTHIDGVPVVGLLEQTCELAQRHGIPQVLITSGELSGKEVRELVNDGQKHDVEVRVLPNYQQIISGNVSLQPRTVSIEDLLHRDPVQLETAELRQWITGRTVLVTGSAGSIGSEICRQLLRFSPGRLVLVDRSENGQFFLERELRKIDPACELEVCLGDVTDAARMDRLFDQFRPDIVFHAAAYKHVPMVEGNIGEAVKNIPLATQNLADLADQYLVKSFVMISTDKAVNPTSVMGTCKRVAELYVQALADHSDCRFVTVRFGNVLDSAGSVVPIFREQIAQGGPVTVTHRDMVRYFMTIPEASQLVIQAGAMGKGGEIFVLDMGEPVRIVDLAKDMIRLSGFRVGEDIAIEFTGLRPGEKMFEELYIPGERYTATPHSKITVAASHDLDVATVRDYLDALAAHRDGDELRDPRPAGPNRPPIPTRAGRRTTDAHPSQSRLTVGRFRQNRPGVRSTHRKKRPV